METAKVFANGGSQAVRLPKNCRFEGDEVFVNRIGNVVILMQKNDTWSSMLTAIDMFTEDFLNSPVDDLPLQERDGL